MYQTMNNLFKTWCVVAAATAMTACTTHYRLTNVSRTRLVVDARYDVQPDAQAEAFLAPYKHKVDSVMGPVVGYAAHNMAAQRPESDLSNLLPDILMWAAKDYGEKPQFAVYNVGGIRSALTKGMVTYGDVLAIAPFENKICFLTLTGDRVTELFEQIAHRGGEGVSHGVELTITSDGKLRSARLNGEPIDPRKTYRIATIDYLAQGNDGLRAFREYTNLNSPQEESNNTRFIIIDYFKSLYEQGLEVSAKVEGRIKIED